MPNSHICGLQEGTHLHVDSPVAHPCREAAARPQQPRHVDFSDGVGDKGPKGENTEPRADETIF